MNSGWILRGFYLDSDWILDLDMLGGSLGHPGAFLGTSGDHTWVILEPSGDWGNPGTFLGHPGVILGPSWDHPGATCDHTGGLGLLGESWVVSWVDSCAFGCTRCAFPEEITKMLGSVGGGGGRGNRGDKDEYKGEMLFEWPWWGRNHQRAFGDALPSQDQHGRLEWRWRTNNRQHVFGVTLASPNEGGRKSVV